MGLLVDGVWRPDATGSDISSDRYERSRAQIRNWVTRDGSAGPTGTGGFAAENGRYHLYVAWNCPWAHRTLLMRALKGLQEQIPISVLAPKRTEDGWVFDPSNNYVDTLSGASALYEIYSAGTDKYTGRVTVPVLWDTLSNRLVSNESADIIRMFNGAFQEFAETNTDYFPEPHQDDIEKWNNYIYPKLNNGVYRAGFAGSQTAYDDAVEDVFEALDRIEAALDTRTWLLGDDLTEADIRLFPTLARFDVAYWSAFKCNKRRLIDYPNLWAYARRFHALPGISETVKLDIYRRGYHSKSAARNPHGIVPLGPEVNFAVS
ncbi:MAG: glutathione S-transferase C-terminal domain-containing protein [Roseibium sp.]|uniref:glutathione S-transferase family protein n=1 Tax=Roseibium sp. TaxID=1936156 RepID=UPI00261DC28C|nr:glutathione S-transferase C-terminal domain-containing protein [Roseibium sp.]MCV0425954.1 glutathione S-transferase C-terminal domain-containing protein [Roseibium sp.]